MKANPDQQRHSMPIGGFQSKQKIQLHFNKPQLRSLTIGAPTEIFIAGRGTGKSEGVLAVKSAKCYFGTMPRGTGAWVGATYSQLFTRTLPALIAGYDRLGYIYNHHYTIGVRPKEKWIKQWTWKGPHKPPLSYKYFMCWWNGAGAHLISQDRPGGANGLTLDWFGGDEAKLLNQKKLKEELFPTNRGIVPAFAGNPYHHGYTLTSDMPIGTAGMWLLDMMNGMDREIVNQIWQLQVARYQLRYFQKKQTSDTAKREWQKQIDVVDAELNDLRKGLLYYHEASTLDNVHAVGEEFIYQQLRDTTPFQFETQILNLRPLRLENGFYPDFDEEIHGYFAEEETYFDNCTFDVTNPVFDCRKDKDLNPDAPLHIGIDYNRRIHPITVFQPTDKEIRMVNAMHVSYPEKLSHALKKFIEYYKPHKRKFIYYWYDHTAVSDEHETRRCDDVINALRKAGWIVKPMYLGQSPSHEVRYNMWGHFLSEDGTYEKKFTVNRENCRDYIMSVSMAQAERRENGFGKDKRTERDENFPAQHSTHYSEAGDTPVYGILESKLSFGVETTSHGGIIIGD
jgi:hypothetical protein